MIPHRRRWFIPLPSPAPAAPTRQQEEFEMAYGLNPRLFVENGPAILAADAQERSSSASFRAWKRMDTERRLALVERTLRPANDEGPDDFPIAL